MPLGPINDYIQGDVVDESINTTSDQAVADAAGAILTGATRTPCSCTSTTWT